MAESGDMGDEVDEAWLASRLEAICLSTDNRQIQAANALSVILHYFRSREVGRKNPMAIFDTLAEVALGLRDANKGVTSEILKVEPSKSGRADSTKDRFEKGALLLAYDILTSDDTMEDLRGTLLDHKEASRLISGILGKPCPNKRTLQVWRREVSLVRKKVLLQILENEGLLERLNRISIDIDPDASDQETPLADAYFVALHFVSADVVRSQVSDRRAIAGYVLALLKN